MKERKTNECQDISKVTSNVKSNELFASLECFDNLGSSKYLEAAEAVEAVETIKTVEIVDSHEAPKRKRGRPKKQLDVRLLFELAKIQCTNPEICAVMRISPNVLYDDRYIEIVKSGRESGKMSLRRAQWRKAVEEGNPQMLIFLGKFYLGQKEELILNSTEPEVRELLRKWDITAKSRYDNGLSCHKGRSHALGHGKKTNQAA